VATITGQRGSSALPRHDTPGHAAAFPGITRAELARAVPPASRRITGQRQALRDGLACPDLAQVRADFRANLEAWWRVHVHHASWGGGRYPRGTTQPTRARVCELAGMSPATYKRCRRWWEQRGYAAVVRGGRTPALRPMALAGGAVNERQVLVLCVPRRPPASASCVTEPLTRPRSGPVRNPARVRAEDHHGGGCAAAHHRAAARRSAPRPPQLARGPLAAVTDGWWAHLTAPFTSGWTASDMAYAVDHDPSGRQHRHATATIRHPAAWLAWRLGQWVDRDGQALPSPSQQRAAAAAAHRADLAARRQADPRAAARADQLRAAAAVLEDQADAAGQAPAAEILARLRARLRARLGAGLGPRWRDPAELAAQQAAESRAARAAAGPGAGPEAGP
jgi:hypothetical protein